MNNNYRIDELLKKIESLEKRIVLLERLLDDVTVTVWRD
tara:strand:+ start:228 stop:344 length:117 start_codon:yes stop_codon:yes gene_type:complete